MAQQDDNDDPWSLAAIEKSPATDDGPVLSIQSIDGVEPLDEQFGVHPPKTVPDVLHEPLFGQPEPTEAEIAAAGGNPENVPPMQTYAILDAAKVVNLAVTLGTTGLEHRCLFKGEAYDELKDVAPWIVRLEEGDKFTRHLFTAGKAQWYLWGKEPGIFIRSRADLDTLWRHFRKFTKVQDEQGKWYYFRFWEPPHLPSALKGFTSAQLCSFLRGNLIFFVLACNMNQCQKIWLRSNFRAERQTQFVLTQRLQHELGKSVEKEFLRKLIVDAEKHPYYSEVNLDDILQGITYFGFSSRKMIRNLLFWSLDEKENILRKRWAAAELDKSRGMPDEVRYNRLKNLSRKVY